VVCDVFTLERGPLTADTVGLRLAEANDLLAAVQQTLVAEQALPDRSTPELVYLRAKFGGLISYGLSARLLGELLPLGRTLHATTVRRHTYRVGQRLDDDLGPERPFFVEGCPADWEELPRPDLPLTVSLDGGYVHSARQRSRRDGWFEVIAGKSVPAAGPAKCFGFVQTHDTSATCRHRHHPASPRGRGPVAEQRAGRHHHRARRRRVRDVRPEAASSVNALRPGSPPPAPAAARVGGNPR
jgi:hypothetical protein